MPKKPNYIGKYLSAIECISDDSDSTEELSARIEFANFLTKIFENNKKKFKYIHEPTIKRFGRPDFLIKCCEVDVHIGYIETKPIGTSLDNENNLQISRYKSEIDNLIVTDYYSFLHFEYGKLKRSVNYSSTDYNQYSDIH